MQCVTVLALLAPSAVLPGADDGYPDRLGPVSVVLAVLLALLALGWSLYARALRVDRLHRQVLGSRATLEAQLVHRAQAASDLAAVGALDPASALLLSRAAHDALDAEGPLVDDGLDPSSQRPSDNGAASLTDRARVESDLTRVIRTILSPDAREGLSREPVAQDCLARLDRAAYRLVLARSFHNTHVAEARRLRAGAVVRLARLAGHAPMPQTFDIDDDTTPSAAPVPQEEQP